MKKLMQERNPFSRESSDLLKSDINQNGLFSTV